MARQVRRSKLRAQRRLQTAFVQAEHEAANHPAVTLREEFALTPYRVLGRERALLETHLQRCKRCKTEHDSIVTRRGFYSRQHTVFGDCG